MVRPVEITKTQDSMHEKGGYTQNSETAMVTG
jgi:hypothetical protein